MAKKKTYKGVTYEEAESQARKLLGPRGRVHFGKYAPKDRRFMVGAWTRDAEGKKAFGVVGDGRDWPSAIQSAKLRIEAVRAEEEKLASGNDDNAEHKQEVHNHEL